MDPGDPPRPGAAPGLEVFPERIPTPMSTHGAASSEIACPGPRRVGFVAHARLAGLALAGLAAPLAAQITPSFVNWESPHVHPVELTPDRTRLLAVNTADARLQIFDVQGPLPVPAGSIPVGLDPVSVRARNDQEAWVVNQISDSVSIVDLAGGQVRRTLSTDDEPADVVFSNTSAFVSCSQTSTVLVFDLSNLDLAPTRIALFGQDPRALAISADKSRVYCAIFQSGNATTLIGGVPLSLPGAFPPDAVSLPNGPYGGANPPPNGPNNTWIPPQSAGLPTPLPVGLIVRKDANDRWRDDRGSDWTNFVSGAQAVASGRRTGWDLPDNDIAVINTTTLGVFYSKRLMNACMAIGVVPSSGDVVVVGTDATNEVRFEPVLKGRFVRVRWARVSASGGGVPAVVDLNPHLDYQSSTLPQPERDLSIGDPRAIVFRSDGSRGYIAGMGSNNVVVVDAQGQRAGIAPTIAVGEGPTGLALDEPRERLYVLDRFEAAISVVDTQAEMEVARLSFHDASPMAIRIGRKHLYNTRATSGLGQASCASCHIDGRVDRLAWDLGDPSGTELPSTPGQNLGGNVPGLNTGFTPFHPMKGPMVTQTFQDIIGKEPFHWRGDRKGLEAFNDAFFSLLGDDTLLTPTQMQEFEDFLATLTFPPNPHRRLDNSLSTSLPLPGHFTTGRFGPVGLPLPNGNAQRGLALFRPPNLLDGATRACVSCHTSPSGMGTDFTFNSVSATFTPFPVGPLGEHHHAIVAGNGVTTLTLKIPHLRSLNDKLGFNTTQLNNTAGFGLMHDGGVDSIERLVSEPVFDTASNQDVADLTAFMLSFSGSELPLGSAQNTLDPPGTLSNDTHAAVGRQVTIGAVNSASTAQIQLIGTLSQLAANGRIGLVAHLSWQGIPRGLYFTGSVWQSDRVIEVWTTAQLMGRSASGNELTFTAVARGTHTRLAVDRDLDGEFDRDELDQGTDPADPFSNSGSCAQTTPALPTNCVATHTGPTSVQVTWVDNANNESSYLVERELTGTGAWHPIGFQLPPNTTSFLDPVAPCATALSYRVSAVNCVGSGGGALAHVGAGVCCSNPLTHCTPKVNSLGCTPAIGFTGVPRSSLPFGFTVKADNVRNNKAGLLFYGTNGRQDVPFQGGSLCVKPPIKRTTSVNSGGTPPPSNDCTGVYALDMNAFAASQGGAISLPGTVVQVQWWGRDPGFPAPNNTALSDGLEYTVCP